VVCTPLPLPLAYVTHATRSAGFRVHWRPRRYQGTRVAPWQAGARRRHQVRMSKYQVKTWLVADAQAPRNTRISRNGRNIKKGCRL